MRPSRRAARWLGCTMLLLAGCVPDVDLACTAGEAYCVAKADGTCAAGLRPLGVWSSSFEQVRFRTDGAGDALVCCPESSTKYQCTTQVDDRQSELAYIEGDTQIAIETGDARYGSFGNSAWTLRLAAGAELRVSQHFAGTFASLTQAELDELELPVLPGAWTLTHAFFIGSESESSYYSSSLSSYALLYLPSPRTSMDMTGRTLVFYLREECLTEDYYSCEWTQAEPSSVQQASDGSAHLTPPYFGLYVAVSE